MALPALVKELGTSAYSQGSGTNTTSATITIPAGGVAAGDTILVALLHAPALLAGLWLLRRELEDEEGGGGY